MKYPLFIFLITVMTVNLVRPQKIEWEKSYGGNHADYLMGSQWFKIQERR